jgi:hypothetical protein
MDKIIIDGLFQYILEFNDYVDYSILIKVNSLFREFILYETDYNDFIEICKKSHNNDRKKMFFVEICKKGKLKIAKWFYYYYSIDNSNYINYAFVMSCKNNHLELSKWLYSIGAYPLCWNYYPFYKSCINGHLEISKWLYLFSTNETDTKEIIIKIIIRDHLNIIKWFDEIGKISDYYEIFLISLIYEKKNIIKWLISDVKIPICDMATIILTIYHF